MRLIILIFLYFQMAYGAPRVLVTIPPIHSLCCAIMQGVSTPDLLLKGSESPHHFTLKPSHIHHLVSADLIIWIGDNLETFLIKPLNVHGKTILTLSHLTGLIQKPIRFSCDAHNDQNHSHSINMDPHIWLNLENAVLIVQSIQEKLSTIDPAHHIIYRRNSEVLIHKILQLKQHIITLKKDIIMHYLAFHDAYQYMEQDVGFKNIGIINDKENQTLSFKKLSNLHDLIKNYNVCCIFSEPQNTRKLINQLAGQYKLCQAELDPLGAHLKPGSLLYFDLMQQLYFTFQTCEKKNVNT